MGKVFAYNSGKPEDSPATLSLTYGLFFDGTLNNRENTKIWKKVRGIDNYGSPTKEEKEIYTTMAQKRKGWFNSERVDIDNNSYLNDFSNVARKSMSCDEPYTIYVEGIGTKTWGKDDTDGYAYGRSTTGIPAKVTKGCEALAEKVRLARQSAKKPDDIKSIIITLDIFGFSRGAAAARYCAYNLQKRDYFAKNKNTIEDYSYYTDHEGYLVDKQWVKNGKLPPMGNLGLALLKEGLDRELVEAVQIRVRFLGIYDTVASYDPDCIVLPSFRKKIKKLHLDELGNPQKIVHLTSMDEHRTYFPLTRIKPGERRIERNFPGVHSDIGGSYANYTDVGSEKRIIQRSSGWNYKKTKDYYLNLIQSGWYTDKQLKFHEYNEYKSSSCEITGERNLRKEYSYIFLHFMRDESEQFIGDAYMPGKIEADYSLNGNEFLQKIKERLQYYTLEENLNWVLRSEKQEIRAQEELLEENETDCTSIDATEVTNAKGIEIEEVIVEDWDAYLKKLRNEYLHWSSIWGKLGYAPNKNRKREFYNADGTLG